MIRLRVSTLEAFRRVIQTDYGNEAELIERIKRGQWVDGPSSWQMDAGTAWHSLLAGNRESGYIGRGIERESSGGYWFDGSAIATAKQQAGPGLCEVTRRRPFIVGSPRLEVEVEGTADHVHGLVLTDHKTCFSGADCKHYEPSLQWRFYLVIHGAMMFRYLLYDFREPKAGYCELKGITACRFWAYPEMEADLRGWLARFLDWCSSRNLISYLERK